MKDMESAIQAKDVEANSGKNKPLNRSTTAFNDIAHKNSVPLAEWSSSKLEPIDATLLSIRPGFKYHETHQTSIPCDVFMAMTIVKVRDINHARSSANIRLFLALQWETGFVRKAVDESQLWFPSIKIVNNDDMVIQAGTPTYYPQSGSAKMVYTIDGNSSQEYDLRFFPWDIDDYRLMIVAGHTSQEVRLFWQGGRDIVNCTPKYLNRQLTEYNLVEDLNKLTRLPFIESNNLWGRYNGVQFIFHLKRNTRYYLIKILLIVLFLNVISWASYFMTNDPRVALEEVLLSSPAPSSVDEGSGVLLRRRFLKGGGKDSEVGEDTIWMHIGAERFAERISLLAEIMLACVAFQYLMDESIPKLGFLTTIDELLM